MTDDMELRPERRLAIQHPGEGGTMTDPVSTWPDGPGRVPRPAIVAIRKARGSGSPEIGT